jgi:hypothetical protein
MEAQRFTQFEIPNGLVGLNRNVILDFGIKLLGRQNATDVLRMWNKEDIVKCETSNSKCEGEFMLKIHFVICSNIQFR